MRLITAILVCSFFLTNVASAKGKMIFDLKKQYYSGTLIKKGEEGYNDENKYDVGDVIVTTDTIFQPPAYKYGIFTVDIKEPLQSWNINIKKKNGAFKETTAIRLTSHIGNSFFISFQANDDQFISSNKYKYHGVIQINNETFKGIPVKDLNNEKLTSTISLKKGKLVVRINGKIFLKADEKEFGKLEKVEVELNDNRYDDELLALDISKVD